MGSSLVRTASRTLSVPSLVNQYYGGIGSHLIDRVGRAGDFIVNLAKSLGRQMSPIHIP